MSAVQSPLAAERGSVSPGVRRITLDADGTTLSALLAEPRHTPPRAVVVALHGGGMRAGYFDGQAHPELSLLSLGARLGYTVLAPDRPGYGHSAAGLPEGQHLAQQCETLRAALGDFAARHDTGAGLFLLAHSYGGTLALTTAAGPHGDTLLGLDVSGCGHRFAPGTAAHSTARRHGNWKLNWGPLRLYPDNTFISSGALVTPMPVREREDAPRWPERFRELAHRVTVPTRLTFAEHEKWWRHDDAALAELAALLANTPRTVIDRHAGAGHNISLGHAARAYHLKALAFLEECMAHRGAARPARAS
ncbi:alpha/beta fold hydrolase [Streptomyces xanthochromogenes]|uniref:alpha/beta hydrolase n=1 Tax=Streptomyces xanthochromogenes TaxID=67384 RepID=UPI003439621F